MHCTLFALIASLLVMPLVAASPLPSNSTSILDKRITHSGRGTWYNPETGKGHCGYQDSKSDPVIAISESFYDSSNGVNCNQWIQVTNKRNGKVAYGQARDSCPGCSYYDLDMSPGLFIQLDSLSVGVLQLEWHFMNKGWKP